jgi:hypothetical protein
MFYTLTKTQSLIVENEPQDHYSVELFEDAEKTKLIGHQTFVVGGDALKDPEAAFLDGLNASTDKYKPTYIQKRAIEYPPIVDQLDTIFHDGLDVWKSQIQAVKNKYPKGE